MEITKEIRDYLLSIGYPNKEKIYYIEVWLWLWREKKIKVSLDLGCRTLTSINADYWIGDIDNILKDPEEAIINTIEYLVEYKLLK